MPRILMTTHTLCEKILQQWISNCLKYFFYKILYLGFDVKKRCVGLTKMVTLDSIVVRIDYSKLTRQA